MRHVDRVMRGLALVTLYGLLLAAVLGLACAVVRWPLLLGPPLAVGGLWLAGRACE